MMNNEKYNQRIKLLRRESKLTQEQMASYLNVDQSLVTKLENGKREEMLLDAFRADIVYNLNEEGIDING